MSESEQLVWIVMPVLADQEKTTAAIADCLAQSIPTRLLVINQGVDDPFRAHLERLAEEYPDRILIWSHQPPLPSLAATWNRALRFVWEAGGSEALVVNNDVRLRPDTVYQLSSVMGHSDALFVSAVGVTEADFAYHPTPDVLLTAPDERGLGRPMHLGGPDFSCFLISRACHERFAFDERFIPAFCEDLDYHRRLLLAGEGARIFSVNVPYLHYASNTLKTLPAAEAAVIRRQIELQSRAYYAMKWGGAVNAETYWAPFDTTGTAEAATAPRLLFAQHCPEGPTTPALFNHERKIANGQTPRRPEPL